MARSKAERLWLGGGALVAVIMILVGWAFLISPARGRTSDLHQQLADAQLANDQLQARITDLNAERARMATYRQALVAAREALPAVDDRTATPTLLRSLQSIAGATSTKVSSVTVGQPVAAVTTAPTTSSAVESSSSAASTAAPTDAVTPPPSMYSIPITATVTGSMNDLKAFVSQLQSVQPRAVLLTDVTFGSQAPAATTTQRGGSTTNSLYLTFDVFAVPPSATAAAGVPTTAEPTPAEPSPAAPTPAATPSS